MSREKAIRICNNLLQTIEKIPDDVPKYVFAPPQANKKNLVKILLKLKYKHNITDSELNNKQWIK